MITEAKEISNTEDVIDVRDIIERVEELESRNGNPVTDEHCEDYLSLDEREELTSITALLSDLEGNGGDHEWNGSWYPVTLIRDSYFENYAQELAEDIGAIDRNATWPLACINWVEAASQLQIDYSTVEFDGVTYWYR